MKCISLWQPWASAVALGIKKVETRGWQTRHRGPLLIHAAKPWGILQKNFLSDAQRKGVLPEGDYPLGAILCRVNLDAIEGVETLLPKLGEIERLLGNYAPGRYGWKFGSGARYANPIPYKGAQGIFEVPNDFWIAETKT